MVTELPQNTSAESHVRYINPNGLPKSDAFTNVIVVTGSVRTVYVGGQDAVDESGTIVGKGDIRTQAEQVLDNLQAALVAGGASLEHVIKWNVYVAEGQPPQPAFEAFQRVWGDRPTHLPLRWCSYQDWRTLTFYWRWMRLRSFRNNRSGRLPTYWTVA